MPQVSETFQQLAGKLGGFNPAALHSFMYWNNPFALKHWTMNVVEILMIAGAGLGLAHAIGVFRQQRNPAGLFIWFAAFMYMLVAEVPLYFPQLIGGDPNQVYFLHNEFTVGFFYDRAPLYIMALYPAMLYPIYLFIERAGIFEFRFGFFLGAVCVGFTHQCFYEIFDHFGPQYGWWIWNYKMFDATLASVPLSSLFTFSFFAPFAFALLTRLLLSRYVNKCREAGRKAASWQLVARAVITGTLTVAFAALISPDSYHPLLPGPHGVKLLAALSFLLLAGAGLITFFALLGARQQDTPLQGVLAGYPLTFFAAYLAVFAALWVYALPEYLAAVNGITARGTPIGSLPYVIGCYFCCLFILYRGYALQARWRVARRRAGSLDHPPASR